MRAFLAAGLLACGAIACSAAIAQPVAALDVAKGSKSTVSQHDRIELKLDRVLELLKVPATPTTPTGPTKPADPPAPPDPLPPPNPLPPDAASNPFSKWCSDGWSFVDIQTWGLKRALTPDEVKLALAAGCGGPGDSANSGGPSTPASGPDPNGYDLGAGGGTVLRHQVAAGQAITFTFTISPPGRVPELYVFGVSGSHFERITDWGPGFDARVTVRNDGRYAPLEGVWLPPGAYSYTVAPQPGGNLGIQLN